MKGKVALVTGGNSGIGRATAVAFAKKGAQIVIAARDQARSKLVVQEIEELGGKAAFIQTDLQDSKKIRSLFSEIFERYGRLDFAVNNAATSRGTNTPLIEFSEEEFDEVISINLKSVWLCMKHEIIQMKKQETGGAIVNVASINGLGGARNGALYSASKSGVIALTKSAAQEVARDNIRVNVFAAGPFRTPMLEGVMEKAANGDAQKLNEINSQYENAVPIGRIGHPQEAANTIVWLCSSEASFVTGHSMIADGGLTAYAR